MKLIDRVLPITGPDAIQCSKDLATKEGIFVGITSGGTLAGALKIASEAEKGATILCMLPDTGERYLVDAAVRRRPGRHDAGGTGDLALDADRAVPGLSADLPTDGLGDATEVVFGCKPRWIPTLFPAILAILPQPGGSPGGCDIDVDRGERRA